MTKLLIGAVIVAALALGGFYALNSYIYNEKQATAVADPKDAEYLIEGQRVKLENGFAEVEVAPGSASNIVTRYFGNELKTDLNGDGREDIAFKNKAHRNAVNKKVMAYFDKKYVDKSMPMPMDMKRFAYGGFSVQVS